MKINAQLEINNSLNLDVASCVFLEDKFLRYSLYYS